MIDKALAESFLVASLVVSLDLSVRKLHIEHTLIGLVSDPKMSLTLRSNLTFPHFCTHLI